MRLIRWITSTVARFVQGRSNSASVVKNLAIRVALLALNFGTGVIVARSLGPTGRGEQAAIGMWPPFIATLLTLGIPTALNFHSRRLPEHAKRLYMGSAIAMLAIGLVVSAIGAAAMPLLLHGYDTETIRAAQWFMLFAPETLVASAARAHLESQDQFTRSTLGFFYPNVATLLALCVLRLTGHLTPVTASLSYVIPPAVQAFWIVSRLWQRDLFKINKLMPDLRLLLPYGLKCYGIDIIAALSGQMDLVIIVAFLSPAQLGLYTVALSLSRVMNIVQSSVVTILFSRASSLPADEAVALVGRAARLSSLSSVGVGVAFLVVAQIAVPIVYGPPFLAVLPVLAILTAENILAGLVVVHFQAFMATGRPAIVTIIEVGWTVSAIGLLFILVPRMNLTGAATALLLAACARLAFVLVAYPLVLHRPLPRLWLNALDLAYIRDKLARIRIGGQNLSTDQATGNAL